VQPPSARLLRMTEYEFVVYRRVWRGSIFNTFANPLLFLLAMGLGLGSVIDEGSGSANLDGLDYVAFVAPGLMAASAMFLAVNEATFPVLASVKWIRTGYGQVATPLAPADIALGHLLFVAARLLVSSAVFAAVVVLLGAAESPGLVLAVPASVLCGLAFAAPVQALSITLDSDHAFPALNRFVILPMFLFSGTFFPVDQLPAPLEPVAWFTPLWHGVSLCRTLALGEATVAGTLAHVAVLAAIALAGVAVALRNYERRLRP
jgi:lipooligosaccharide transport system permease protein